MADTIGLTTLPIAAPASVTDVVGDMLLQRLGEFLKAALNRMGDAAWLQRGGAHNVVEHVFYHNPQRLFDDQRLPALYLWRSTSDRRREGDDVCKVTSRITVYWIAEPAQEDTDTARAPFERAVDVMMARALHRERDSAWVVAGDTDPLAATQGSFLPTWLGYNWMLKANSSELELTKQVTDGDGSRVGLFYGLATGVDVEELAAWDSDLGTYPPALDATIHGNPSEGDDGPELGWIYDPE